MCGISATSACVHTACTPGSARAASASIELIVPCATSERTMRMCNWPGNEISAAYRPRPNSSGRSSRRGTERPMNFRLSDMRGRSSFSHLNRCGTHRLDDVLVAGATTQIRGEHVEKVFVADIRIALQNPDRQHQEPRCTETALQRVMIHEGLLHWMQPVAVSQAFDGPDLLAVGLHGEHQAGAHRFAIDNDRASAAHTMLATDMGSRLSAILTDGIGQGTPRLDGDRVIAAVDIDRNGGFIAHATFSALRKAAHMRCGVAGISLISTRKGESASLIALITAAGAPIVPPSPNPFALVIEFTLGVSM